MRTEPTFLGVVRKVVGARVWVELTRDLGSSPIIDGRVYHLGQVGSFVRFPLGYLNLYGIVSQVTAHIEVEDEETPMAPIRGQRFIDVQLVGESYARECFERGVSVFPTLEDEAHMVTHEDLALIYGDQRRASCVTVGHHAVSESLPAFIDLDKLVSRHCAIVGSTGSGKSNTVAQVLKSLTAGGFPSARVVIIDPHGEYETALKDRARVFRINDPTWPLIIPYWALSFDELAWFLVDRKTGTETQQDGVLRTEIRERKTKVSSELKAGQVDRTRVTSDSPIPFDLCDLWYQLDRAERITYEDQNRTQEALVKEGDAEKLIPADFKPPGPGSSPPFKPLPAQGAMPMLQYTRKILARLRDPRYDLILKPGPYDGIKKDLDSLVSEWVDHEQPLTILDLGGVPFEVIDVAVGGLTRLLFDAMFWGRDVEGTGRQRPLLLVFEEAHSYLPKGERQFIQGYALRAVQRIFKEGRKYGIGAILVSQRPSELDESLLSQCGTFFALRLTNSTDHAHVRSVVSDSMAGLTDLVPVLRTGEALILGEGVQLPSRARITEVSPRPKSADPEIASCWRNDRKEDVPHDQIVTAWRQQQAMRLSGNKINSKKEE